MLLFGDMVNVNNYHIHNNMLQIEYRNSAHRQKYIFLSWCVCMYVCVCVCVYVYMYLEVLSVYTLFLYYCFLSFFLLSSALCALLFMER